MELVVRAGEEHDGDGLGSGLHLAGNDGAAVHAGLLAQGLFEVCRVDVHAGGGDDDVAFAAEEAQLAGLVFGGEIAGGEPLAFALMHCAERQVAAASMSPRTRISPSSLIRTSRPGRALPMVPWPIWKGWLRVTSAAVSVMP